MSKRGRPTGQPLDEASQDDLRKESGTPCDVPARTPEDDPRTEHDELLRALNADFQALRDDRTAWSQHQAETADWDRACLPHPGDEES